MKILVPFLALLTTLISGCNIAPYRWTDNGKRVAIQAIDSTRITVKEEFRYSPTLTSYVLPAGEYLPVRSDADGTYYESARGILVLATTGGFVVRGGIYRRSDPNANYPFAVYVNMPVLGWTLVDLHSLWGLNLNEKIVCNPPHVFK
jgi:hypothetical protein